MDSILPGYRILDLTDEKGSLCAKTLGDLGADVVKIEKVLGINDDEFIKLCAEGVFG